MRRVDPVYMSLAERLGESSNSILIKSCPCPLQPCSHLWSFSLPSCVSKEQYIRWEHVCFHCCSLFGVDCIISTAVPRETCQSQPAQINHQLSCLSYTADWFSSMLRGTVVQFCVGLVHWANWWNGGVLEGLRATEKQIGIDRNQSLVMAARGLGDQKNNTLSSRKLLFQAHILCFMVVRF